ncbi:MAG: DNA polymerase III subunit chi [Arsenophonus sp. NC-QC1-MAG3]
MKKVTFYLITQLFSQKELESHEWLACQLAAKNWRIGKRILIACEHKIQAKKLDKILWQREPYQFTPHNLAGEGPPYGAPVELCWPTKQNISMRDILINLQSTFVNFSTHFHEVIDFVPIDEHLKQLARERYKTYHNMGFNLIMAYQHLINNEARWKKNS